MQKLELTSSVGVSILKGACNPKATDLAVQLGEIGLDSLMDEGVLKEIEVQLYAGSRAGSSCFQKTVTLLRQASAILVNIWGLRGLT